jgi:hypothetical protein
MLFFCGIKAEKNRGFVKSLGDKPINAFVMPYRGYLFVVLRKRFFCAIGATQFGVLPWPCPPKL